MKTHRRIKPTQAKAKYIKLYLCDRDLNTELNRYNKTKGCTYVYYYTNKRTKTKPRRIAICIY